MPNLKNMIFETTTNSYKTQEIIGQGGSGKVYKVEDSSGDTFAIKYVDSSNATGDKLKRFKNELSFCSKNKHKNIITVLDHGFLTAKGKKSPFYVMPYCRETLRRLMQKKIDKNKIPPYFSQILDGVEAAHLQSIWHRDLKPENILYDPITDTLIVADFGIAHFAQEQLYTSVETAPHARLANFQYAAPEQRVRNKAVDHKADIYALGLILYETFTGNLLQGTNYQKIANVAREYEYLDDLVDLMVRQLPTERPPSIDNIKQQLIARKNEFVSRQKLSQLKKEVVPTVEVDDPLVSDPIRLVSVDYQDGNLIFILSRPVNRGWIDSFQQLDNYAIISGMELSNFVFSEDKVIIRANEREAYRLPELFKEYLAKANLGYRKRVEATQRQREDAERKRLEQQIIEEEARQRILKSVKI